MSENAYSYTPYQVYGAENQPNLRVILLRYLKHWKWFVLSLLLAGAGAYIYLIYQTPIYKVQASLLIKDDKKGLDGENILKEMDILKPKKTVENEIEIIKSYTLMDKVVNKLNLDVQYFRPTKTVDQEVYSELPIRLVVEQPFSSLYGEKLQLSFVNSNHVRIDDQVYPVNQSIKTPHGRLRVFASKPLRASLEPLKVVVSPRTEVVNGYLKNLTVETTSKASTVLQITLEEAVPAKGEALMRQLIEEYNQAAVVDKNLVAASTLDFIEDRLRLISGELTNVEKDVESYKTSEGITDLSVQAQSFLQTVQANDAQLNQVNIQLSSLKDIERYVDSKADSRGTTPGSVSLSDPVLLGLVTKLTDLELQRDVLARTTSERNPLLQTLDGQVKSTKESISENIQTIKQQLTSTKNQLTSTNRKMESMVRTVPHKERALLNITRQQAIKNNLYTYLLQKREETALSYASTLPDSRTVDLPRHEKKPIRPVRATTFMLFGLIGLLLPVGALAAKDMLNNRVVRRSDVEDVSRVPILGEVVQSDGKKALVVVSKSRSVIAEQIRALRTNLQFLRSNPNGSQVLLFTSSISGEGKSFMSMNIGASLALVDRPTVILEMDLRKPKLHMSLGMRNAVGISNYLIGEATLDDVLQPIDGFPNYFLISSGPLPPNPSELLNGPYLGKLFEELRARFEYVIVDSPPIGLVTDAQVIAPFADATLYMVRHDITPKTYLKMVDSLYKENRFHNLNVILNAVGDGESYYYSYSYGGYYEDDKSDKKARKALS
ncbi:GumC family protein [Spirosoma radiotolerans]|uniref:Capsular biosynthesis protein n=1 Tax=Spirosoma radiotolerans TaxID=1379870 RepID=A0A0E3ZXP9_9BACT|nr:tyrosine-protein kinase [Spirosoma radiotolerans]AKD57060.1 capsular biosynthesis protein [Spirosoma radiotolerans]